MTSSSNVTSNTISLIAVFNYNKAFHRHRLNDINFLIHQTQITIRVFHVLPIMRIPIVSLIIDCQLSNIDVYKHICLHISIILFTLNLLLIKLKLYRISCMVNNEWLIDSGRASALSATESVIHRNDKLPVGTQTA